MSISKKNLSSILASFIVIGLMVSVAFAKKGEVKSKVSPNIINYVYSHFALKIGYAFDHSVIYQRSDWAVKWYKISAQSGNSRAMHYLGQRYFDGRGVKKDLKQSFQWYKKSAQTSFLIQKNLIFWIGDCYSRGRGVEKDYGKANLWLKKSAELGNSEAMVLLAYHYERGLGISKKDLNQKQKQKSLQERLFDGSQSLISDGNEDDDDRYQWKAVRWYLEAAELGNGYAFSALGRFYATGKGVAQDKKESFYWYLRGAEKGDDTGVVNVAYAYRTGEGVERSYKKAIFWFKKGAEKGDSRSIVELGYMYENGEGVKIDYAKAHLLYQTAIKKGDTYGMYCLAYLYNDGHGVKKDSHLAAQWFLKSLQSTNTAAYNDFMEDGKDMSKATLRAVQNLLKQAGHYKGRLHGRLTKQMKLAISKMVKV